MRPIATSRCAARGTRGARRCCWAAPHRPPPRRRPRRAPRAPGRTPGPQRAGLAPFRGIEPLAAASADGARAEGHTDWGGPARARKAEKRSGKRGATRGRVHDTKTRNRRRRRGARRARRGARRGGTDGRMRGGPGRAGAAIAGADSGILRVGRPPPSARKQPGARRVRAARRAP